MADIRVTIRLETGETEQYEIEYLPTLEAAYAADARRTDVSRRADSPAPAPKPAPRRPRVRKNHDFGLTLDRSAFGDGACAAPTR